jgi:hypothetical protein
MKSRIVQALLLIILFVLGVIVFNSMNAPQPEVSNEGYVPPSP